SISARLHKNPLPLPENAKQLFNGSARTHIGISPFAKHATKVYPLDRMKGVVKALAAQGHTVLLFGGGKKEAQICEQWASMADNIRSLVGHYNLEEELAIISNLTLMVSMDSAGMHMASLMNSLC